MPTAIVAVTNDLTTDQRVDRTCRTLEGLGYDVMLVGRQLPNSKTLAPRSYRTHRLRLLFTKGPLFYAEYNMVLFFYLAGGDADLLVSNDTDTLPATRLAWFTAGWLRRVKDIFSGRKSGRILHLHDCHEYFRGVPELVGRKATTAVWKFFEDLFFPGLTLVTAVNHSVAKLYHEEYRIPVTVLRNVPYRKMAEMAGNPADLPFEDSRPVILYQGAVNVGRGLEEAIAAMKHVTSDAVLVIAGTGDIFGELVRLVKNENLGQCVKFLGQVPFQQLRQVTKRAHIGLSIEKDVSINYHYCLPNKFLDYIQAGVPVLVSPFPEMKAIVDRYDIGRFIESHDPSTLAAAFDAMLADSGSIARYRANLEVAARDLCWENEEGELIRLLTDAREKGEMKNIQAG